MTAQLVKLGLALAALYAVDRVFAPPPRRKSIGWVEVDDNVFANRDAFGRYIDCVDAQGKQIPDSKCFGCGIWGSDTADRPALVTGCPGSDAPDGEDN